MCKFAAFVAVTILYSCASSSRHPIMTTTQRTQSGDVVVLARNLSFTDSVNLPLQVSESADSSGALIFGDTLFIVGVSFYKQYQITLYGSCRGRRVGPRSVDTLAVIRMVPSFVRYVEFERCGRTYLFKSGEDKTIPDCENSDVFMGGSSIRFSPLIRTRWDE